MIPSLREWHQEYNESGLIIIANHYPEFGFEENLESLKEAIKKHDIEYIVTQDNEGLTWRAYNNHYWPTVYIIDKQGFIRYKHIGEGSYQEIEDVIIFLLEE